MLLIFKLAFGFMLFTSTILGTVIPFGLLSAVVFTVLTLIILGIVLSERFKSSPGFSGACSNKVGAIEQAPTIFGIKILPFDSSVLLVLS